MDSMINWNTPLLYKYNVHIRKIDSLPNTNYSFCSTNKNTISHKPFHILMAVPLSMSIRITLPKLSVVAA